MKILSSDQIEHLCITSAQCKEWVKDAFIMKSKCQLPAKISVHPSGNDFFTTMPCLLPQEYGRFGVKVVSRITGRKPALKSDLMLFDSQSGELLAIMNCDWITAKRTGAVATLAIETFCHSNTRIYSFVGLGAMARATMTCLLDTHSADRLIIRLLRYKDQAERMIEEYSTYCNVEFTIVNSMEELIDGADVIVSCITDADGLLVQDTSLFKPGVLVVPVHTRGFQNCDLCFDKVFGDDTDHIRRFKYFSSFKAFYEFGDVLAGQCKGRESNDERILSYNVGLGLHDVYYASKIYDLL